MGDALYEVAVLLVVHGDVVARTIFAEVIAHGGVGVADGDVAQPLTPAILTGPEQQFQVNHVVHDGVVTTIVLDVARP